jgi:hypothetical protein
MAIGIGIGAALLPSLIQAGTAGVQMARAEGIKEDRPEYNIPESAQQALGIRKRLATHRGLPGQSLIEDKLRGSTAAGVRAVQESEGGGEALGAIAEMYGSEQRGLAQLGIEGERQYLQNQMGLAQGLREMAPYEERAFDINKYQPYQEAARASSMLRGSAQQNIYGAGSGLANYLLQQQAIDIMGQDQQAWYPGMVPGAPTGGAAATSGMPPVLGEQGTSTQNVLPEWTQGTPLINQYQPLMGSPYSGIPPWSNSQGLKF